jgi:hypothetical protein
MLELVALLIVFGAFLDTAKRRGTKGWPFVVAGIVGYLVFNTVGYAVVGHGANLFFGFGWLGLVYLSIFQIGGKGRSMPGTWRCPECRLFNPPDTIVCPCGFDTSGVPTSLDEEANV